MDKKVKVSPEVKAGIDYLIAVLPYGQLIIARKAHAQAQQAGYSNTADWIKKNPRQYLRGIQEGFTYD